jgi:hypothetical protein
VAFSLTDMTNKNGPCSSSPISSRVPNGDIMKAALHSLNTWIVSGTTPANAARFVVMPQSPGMPGSAMVPWFCGPSGNHVDFPAARLCEHYGDPDAYVARVQSIVNANLRDRVLLPEEARKTIDEAKSVPFSCPG